MYSSHNGISYNAEVKTNCELSVPYFTSLQPRRYLYGRKYANRSRMVYSKKSLPRYSNADPKLQF